ncbi:MAG TPA: acyl carrier protein [Acidobacteriaceae bacterium]|nr:acyl carrier protein [Acidobacteriaceae bacterium]
MTIRSAITDQFLKVAGEHGRALAALDDDLPLLECGLDSLCFAVVVTRLEDRFGMDPFAAEDVLFPVTFGEFVRLYESASR